ncbi:MAG: N-acetylglutaminylglutamine amidotransferase [Gemmatimonadales bacterium]|jgi:asparagine synthase (glutamine-hydrolysing)
MCGICGEIRFDGRPASAQVVERMTCMLEPRGPDGSGIVLRDRAAFGQRRLKIFDLSEQAQQPMVDSELGLTLVHNGAVYNYLELRAELEELGYRFFSDGDTEVVLKAYHAWGAEFVHRLNGMFAIAILERDTGRLVCVRDRLGIKPFYYAEVPGGLRFASTLPALAATDGVSCDIDPVALHHYMTFHAVVPAPWTILAGVRKLPPASMMTVEPDGRRTIRSYWQLTFGPRPGEEALGEGEWRDRILDALRQSVRRRLIADVEVGVLLSGGLDSSLVVGLLAEAGAHGLKTFSVGFESVGDEEGDEFRYSDVIASHFGTDHRKIRVATERLLPSLPRCIAAMSEPMVSHDVIGFFLLSEEVSKHVKVVQSGQGADEVFAGYHWYPPMLESAEPVADYARVFFDRDHAEYRQAVQPRFANGDHSRSFIEEQFARTGADRAVDKTLRLDTTVMLVDDPVKRVDNMTMAWGLEARVPFLDHELVELAARVPAELKIRGGGKYVLKEAARLVIPHDVIDRPKGYFPVPALKYLRGPYLDFVRDGLTSARAKERDLFRPDYLDRLLTEPEAHITPLRGSKLWQVALLELWLQTHGL